jgi:hypothetical protein
MLNRTLQLMSMWCGRLRGCFFTALFVGMVAIVLPAVLVDRVIIRSQGPVGLRLQPTEQAKLTGYISDGTEGIVTDASGGWVQVTWRGGSGWLRDKFVTGGHLGRHSWHFMPDQASSFQRTLWGIAILLAVSGLIARYFSTTSRRLRQTNREFNRVVSGDQPWWKSYIGARNAVSFPQGAGRDATFVRSESETSVPMGYMSRANADGAIVGGHTVGKLPTVSNSSYVKGESFEKFIAKKFSDDKSFRIKEWTGDKGFSDGIYVEGNVRPDLKLGFVDAGAEVTFAVECKYRRRLLKGGKLAWASSREQAARYASYQKENKIPVYVAIGLGDDPEAPNRLYVAPLNVLIEASLSVEGIDGLAVDIKAIAKYKSDPAGHPLYDSDKGTLVFSGPNYVPNSI